MSSGELDFNRNIIFPDITSFKKANDINYDFELIQEKNLTMVRKIHKTLQGSHDLTPKQKFAHCKNQRVFMKLYLSGIYNKILLNKRFSEDKKI